MKTPAFPKRKIDALSNGVFFIVLAVLFYTDFWWPGILIAIWAMLALRQWLSNRKFDLIMTSVILGGLFIVSFFNITFSVLIPVLFVLGGLYIIFREFFYPDGSSGEDKAEGIRDDADLDR